MPMFSTGCRMFSHTGYSCRLCGGRSAFCVASRAVVAYGHLGMGHGAWGLGASASPPHRPQVVATEPNITANELWTIYLTPPGPCVPSVHESSST